MHERTATRRRWLVAAIVLGYLLQLGWRLWLARTVDAPAGHPDEDNYLIAARVLAGGPGGYSSENGQFRRIGYPLLLTPLYWVPGDAFDIFRRAQVLGAAAGALVFPLSALVARRVLALPAGMAAGVAFTAALLPAIVFYADLALTDAVLPAFFLAWLLLMHRWLTAATARQRWCFALAAGAAAGYIYTLHVRGTMIALVHVLLAVAVGAIRRRERDAVATALASVGATVAVGALNPIVIAVIGDEIVLVGNDPGAQLGTALSVGWGVALVLLRAVGQLWYLAVATFGLGALGLLAAARPVLRPRHLWGRLAEPRILVLAAACAATVLIAFGSAASLPFGENRITYFAYPRYLHFTYPLWFLVGFAVLRIANARERWRAVSVVTVLLCGAGAVVGWRTAQSNGVFITFDAPEITVMSWQWSRFPVLVPTLVAVALFGLVALARATARPAGAVLAVLAVLCGLAMPVIQQRVIAPMVDPQYAADTPRLVRDLHLGPGDTVAEAWQVRYPDQVNHVREVSWGRVLPFDANQPPPPDANVVIAPWDPSGRGPSWDGTRWGMRFVAGAPRQGWAVWRRGL
jgi:hypothetical protein